MSQIEVIVKDSELVNQIPTAYILYKLRKAGVPLDDHGNLKEGALNTVELVSSGMRRFVWTPVPTEYCKDGD